MDELKAVRELRPEELEIPGRGVAPEFMMTSLLSVRLSWLNDAIEHQANRIVRRLSGLNMLEWRCLLCLCTRGPQTGQEIASLINISPPQASRGLRSLGVKELVSWPAGSRRRYFGPASATQRGWGIYRKLAPVMWQRNEWLLSDLSSAERDELFRLLAVVRRKIGSGDAIEPFIAEASVGADG